MSILLSPQSSLQLFSESLEINSLVLNGSCRCSEFDGPGAYDAPVGLSGDIQIG
jgi:hypothetical protein